MERRGELEKTIPNKKKHMIRKLTEIMKSYQTSCSPMKSTSTETRSNQTTNKTAKPINNIFLSLPKSTTKNEPKTRGYNMLTGCVRKRWCYISGGGTFGTKLIVKKETHSDVSERQVRSWSI